MSLLHGVGDFFALDIGTTSIRLVQLSGNLQHGWNLQHFAYVPSDPQTMQDGSMSGKQKLGELIMSAIKQAGITTKNVAIGMPARKTYTVVIEVPNQDEKEIRKVIKYQLDKYIPMAADEAKADYAFFGQSPNDATKAEVLISSTSINYAEEMLEMIEGLGLNVIAEEPEPLAMTRALMPIGVQDAHIIIDLGERSTDLVVTYHNFPRLVRTTSGGFAGGFRQLVSTVSSTLGVKDEQARQFILKFGLAQDKLEGQVFKALDGTLESFALEITKSIRFFQDKYMNAPIGGITLSGFAGVIPFIAEYIEAKTNIPTTQGNPWQLVRVTPEQQQALMPVASEFAVAIGLAERSND